MDTTITVTRKIRGNLYRASSILDTSLLEFGWVTERLDLVNRDLNDQLDNIERALTRANDIITLWELDPELLK